VLLTDANGFVTFAFVAVAGNALSVALAVGLARPESVGSDADAVAFTEPESVGKDADAVALLLTVGSMVDVSVELSADDVTVEGSAVEVSVGGGKLAALATQAGGDTGTAVGRTPLPTDAEGAASDGSVESVAEGRSATSEGVGVGAASTSEGVGVGESVASEVSVGEAGLVANTGKDVFVAEESSVAVGKTAESVTEIAVLSVGADAETSAVALAKLGSVALTATEDASVATDTCVSAPASSAVSSLTK